ncbi:hypothetical protein QTP88_017646 [Uroleucon formosanum]
MKTTYGLSEDCDRYEFLEDPPRGQPWSTSSRCKIKTIDERRCKRRTINKITNSQANPGDEYGTMEWGSRYQAFFRQTITRDAQSGLATVWPSRGYHKRQLHACETHFNKTWLTTNEAMNLALLGALT